MPLAVSVDHIGWRASFFIIAAVMLSRGVIAMLAVRDAPSARAGASAGHAAADVMPTPADASLGAALRAIPGIVTNVRTWPPVLAAGVNATVLHGTSWS